MRRIPITKLYDTTKHTEKKKKNGHVFTKGRKFRASSYGAKGHIWVVVKRTDNGVETKCIGTGQKRKYTWMQLGIGVGNFIEPIMNPKYYVKASAK